MDKAGRRRTVRFRGNRRSGGVHGQQSRCADGLDRGCGCRASDSGHCPGASRGWRVDIAEVARAGATSGWELCLTRPSLRALDELGLADTCLVEGFGMSVITHVDGQGEPAGQVRLPRLIGAERPALVGIARPVLHRILHAEAERCGVVVHHSLSVEAVAQEGDMVHVVLSDGTFGGSRCWSARTGSARRRGVC
ncbi:FAD-dependent monooxygenase [Streptomyces sp. NBC_01381]|uniref:FAD-dependent monooxygenase n=1 Tax=Streptomyces sp. NBC_01381 TaxID=2903845 RepID=UPI002B1E415D|nr:FAD-dependent monooxygenase [Streptomyces sp. NBC_01381]